MENILLSIKNMFGHISPNYLLIGGMLLGLFLMPALLIPFVPVAIVVYEKKLSSPRTNASGQPIKKIKDPRRGPLALALGTLALLIVLAGVGFEFGMLLMVILGFGICTGGFIWFPLAAYLLSRIILFLYDHFTGNTKYRTPVEIPATVAPLPGSMQAPAPDLSALSPNEQSLALYISDAATRGVRIDEMTLILKSNGWMPEDITHGFDLVRMYYPGVLK